jgi:hypothetical protein
MLAVILAEAFAPLAEFTIESRLREPTAPYQWLSPEHTITCIPTLALQTTATETPSKYGFILITGSCQAVVLGNSASVEHNQQLISIATKHAETRSEP